MNTKKQRKICNISSHGSNFVDPPVGYEALLQTKYAHDGVSSLVVLERHGAK